MRKRWSGRSNGADGKVEGEYGTPRAFAKWVSNLGLGGGFGNALRSSFGFFFRPPFLAPFAARIVE